LIENESRHNAKRKFNIIDFLRNESLFGITTGCEMAQVERVFGLPEAEHINKKIGSSIYKYGCLQVMGEEGIVTGLFIDITDMRIYKLSKRDIFYLSSRSERAINSLAKTIKRLKSAGISYRFRTYFDASEISFLGKRTYVAYDRNKITRIGIHSYVFFCR
jgi:hypothetical protein